MEVHKSVHLLFLVLLLIKASQTQLAENWWDQFSTTTPRADLVDYYDNNYDNEINNEACCECVPFYLCGENNTIIDDGGDIIGPRFGARQETDVLMCSDLTELCCRLPNALPTCEVTENRVTADPNTPCDCINWDFCPEEFIISDGSPSKTFIEGLPLPAHAKCLHSLEVCCAFATETTVSTSPPVEQCLCVNPWLCEDGFIITDGSGLINLRNSPISPDGFCISPQVCCKEPQNYQPNDTTPSPIEVTPSKPSVVAIQDQRCNGIRNSNGISVSLSCSEIKNRVISKSYYIFNANFSISHVLCIYIFYCITYKSNNYYSSLISISTIHDLQCISVWRRRYGSVVFRKERVSLESSLGWV